MSAVQFFDVKWRNNRLLLESGAYFDNKVEITCLQLEYLHQIFVSCYVIFF